MKIFQKIMLLMFVACNMGFVAFSMENPDSKDTESKPNLERCGICMDDLDPAGMQPTDVNYPLITTPCGHTFHKDCLNNCLSYKSTCPLCRANLTSITTLAQIEAQRRHEAARRAALIQSDLAMASLMVDRGEAPAAAPLFTITTPSYGQMPWHDLAIATPIEPGTMMREDSPFVWGGGPYRYDIGYSFDDTTFQVGDVPFYVADDNDLARYAPAPRSEDAHGLSPEQAFIEAARAGNLHRVIQRIALRPDIVNVTDGNGYTALMRAAQHHHTRVVQALIAAGADVNAIDNVLREPALIRALERNRPEEIDIEMVRAIVSAPGFDPMAHHQAQEALEVVTNRRRLDIAALIRPYLR